MPSLSLITLAQTEVLKRTIWYPTILGVLVVVAGVVLFVGSIYLILGTNMGARLAFLATFTGLMGFMVVLTSLWITTASPLNTLKGHIPKWEIKEYVKSPQRAKTVAVHSITRTGKKVDPIEAANVKAFVDAGLVTKADTAIQKFTAQDNKWAKFDDVTQYLATNTWEKGGSRPSFLNLQFTHTPKYAVVQICGTAPNTQPFGVAPDKPTCAADGTTEAQKNGFMVLEYNYGSVRQPPIIAFSSAVILFVLGLVMFNWYEKDKRAADARAAETASAKTPARTREPANV